MSLILEFTNTLTGTPEIANYTVRVTAGGKVIAQGRVAAHRRTQGWRALVKRALSNESDLPDVTEAPMITTEAQERSIFDAMKRPVNP